MGCGGSKTADELTADLWILIEKNLTRYDAANQAEGMLQGGASIKQAKNGKYMIEEVREQEKRNRQANRGSEAENCNRVAKLLEGRASALLVEAVSQGNLTDVQLIAQKLGGDLHQSGSFGQLGLLTVALKSANVSVQLVQYLVESHPANRAAVGLAVTATKPPTPLHKSVANPAVSEYLLNLLNQILLELPATIPLGQGNSGGNAASLVEKVDLLVQNGANPAVTDSHGNNVLCQAVLFGHVPLVRRLLDLGVDSTYENPKTGQTVLQLAESQSQREPVLIALLKNHSFNLQFQHKIASMAEEKECDYDIWHKDLQTLITTGADIHCLNSVQDTPLHLLVRSLVKLDQEDDARFVTMFISDFHADPEKYNAQNYRPVELAILFDRNLRILRELLDATQAFNPKLNLSLLAFARQAPPSEHKDATINLIQTFMNNKLWATCLKSNKRGKNHEAINKEIGSLLQLGADINGHTGDDEHEGFTPLCLVAQQGDVYLVRQLISVHGANPNLASKGESCFNNTPIHFAAEAGQLNSVTYLRSIQIPFNVLNTQGESPLHLAARNGHVRVVKFLTLWGCNPSVKNSEGQTPLDVAKQGSGTPGGASSPISPMSPGGNKKDAPQHALVISFLQRCEPSPVCEEKALIITQVNPQLIDVCPPISLQVPGPLQPTGPADEDPLGETSKGFLAGKPNDNLKGAAKKGNLTDAKAAVSEGADVRHKFDSNGTQSAYHIALQSRDEFIKDKSRASDSQARWAYQSKADACQYVADYLVEVATTKIREAVVEGHEGRVAAYYGVGAKLDNLVPLAASSTNSVGIIHFLIANLPSNLSALFSGFGGPAKTHSPYAVARSKKFDAVAGYIQAQLSVEIAKAVGSNNMSHVVDCCQAGGLPDLDGVENVSVALQNNNYNLVQYLLDQGARLPARYQTVQSIEGDGSLSAEFRLLLRQRFLDRQLRVASSTGNFDAVQKVHQLGADLSARNYAGASVLSLSLQFTHQPMLVHYLVTRGCTMLHSQAGVPSVVPLSRAQGHPPKNILETFLKQSLNVALFNAIMEGDLGVSQELCALGAEVGAIDEAGNTLVHTAVYFQGLDAVKWLTERGAPLNIANEQGEYAITAAVYKGDAASVEFMVFTNAGTKALKNGAGKTALDIAKDMRFNKLVQLMDPGNKDFPVSAEDDNQNEPTQEYDELIRAAGYGQLDVIKIFIEEKYASLARKTQLAGEMVRVAETKNQAEVLRILVPHYKSLTSEAASDQTSDRLVSASAEQKKLLAGFLTGLSGLIAGGEVELDPSDPQTYQKLFSNMSTKVTTQTEFLSKNVGNPGELGKAVTKETQDLAVKMQKLEAEMRAMSDAKTAMTKRLQAQEAQLSSCKTALQKRDCYKEIQEAKDQLHTLSSSVSLFVRAQESAIKKKKTLEALKSQPNLLVAYSTIENRLQGLFLACKTATAGMMSMNMTDSGDKRMQIVDIAAGLSEMIPVIGATLSKVVSVGVGAIVKHMDKNRQQQEISNITTLGNIEELEKAASNAAALVTFYYSAQINAVLTSGEKKAEESVPHLAEYMVLFMIKALQKGDIVPGMDLATQLWFAVASQDPIQPQSLIDRLIGTPGDIVITLKTSVKVTLRALIGSVGVMDGNGLLYIPQPKLLADVVKSKKDFAPFYSVTYLSAFTSQQQAQLLVQRRSLIVADESAQKTFLAQSTKLSPEETEILKGSVANFKEDTASLDGIEIQAVGGATSSSSAEGTGSLTDVNRLSLQVHDKLSEKGLITTPDQVKEMIQQKLAENATEIELTVDTLREDFNTKAAHYQSSIEAATETLTTETEKLKVEHRQVGLELKQTITKQLQDQQTNFTKQVAAQNATAETRLAEVTAKYEATLAEHKSVTDSLKASVAQQLADQQAGFKKQVDDQNAAQAAKLAELTKQYETSLQTMQAKFEASFKAREEAHQAAITKLQVEAEAQFKQQTAAQQAALDKLILTSTAAQTEAAASKAAAEKAQQAAATTLAASQAANEKWATDLATSKSNYDATLKASQEASAKTISEYKASLDGLKTAATTSAASAKQSESAALEISKQMKELRELQAKDNSAAKEAREKELKVLKEQQAAEVKALRDQSQGEAKALLSQAKDAENNANKALDASKNAEKAAKKAASDAEDCKAAVQKLEAKLNK